MDIKRSNRIKKAAAIAALVLVVGGASVAAEVGNAGLFGGEIVSAISTADCYEITTAEGEGEGSIKGFFKSEKAVGILKNDITVKDGFDKLPAGKTLYGNGNIITITGKNALFKTIEAGAKIENVTVETQKATEDKPGAPGKKAAIIESNTVVGAVCCENKGEIRYVTVDAVVHSTAKPGPNSKPADAASGLICGINSGEGKIFGCIVAGALDTQNNYAGSICGKNYGNIERCTSSADITFKTTVSDYNSLNYNHSNASSLKYNNSSKYIGGLCGYNDGKMYDCLFNGT
ncbi:MAG: hypothetical protein IKH50_01400, partial [Oscillospiraceae bacterium]|nr:hypothetical protein [Oscillospiraceae bacterium]